MKQADIEKLVEAAYAQRGRVENEKAKLAEIEARLLELDPGKYSDAGGTTLTVVAPGQQVTYELADKLVEQAKVTAGEAFAKLFDRKVRFAPCKSFADVVGKLLPAGAARKLVDLCQVTKERRAYVLYKP